MAVKFVVVVLLSAVAVASAVPESLANPTASIAQRDSRQKRAYYGGQYTIPTQKDADRIQKQLEWVWNKIKSWGDEGVTTATEVRNDSPIRVWDMEDEGVTLSDATKEQTSKISELLDKIKKKFKSLGDEGVTTATEFQQP